MGGHVGGYFSVPSRTVWICCFLGSPVWDKGPELVGCRLFAPWDLSPLALDFLAGVTIASLSGQLGRGPSSMIDSYIHHPTTSTRSCTLQDIIGAHQKLPPTTTHTCPLLLTTTHYYSLPLTTTHPPSRPLTTTHYHSLPLNTNHYQSLPLTTTH